MEKTVKNTAEEFLTWLQVEKRFAQSSIVSYRSRLKCFVRDVGDIELDKFSMEHIFKLKQILHQRENSEVFIGVCLACIKLLLKSGIDKKEINKYVKKDGKVNYENIEEEMSADEGLPLIMQR